MISPKAIPNPGEGRLPSMAPLANPYVPFQLENPVRYEARKVIKMLEEELEQIRTDRAQEDEKRNKVTMCMGIMTGLLITIILF